MVVNVRETCNLGWRFCSFSPDFETDSCWNMSACEVCIGRFFTIESVVLYYKAIMMVRRWSAGVEDPETLSNQSTLGFLGDLAQTIQAK